MLGLRFVERTVDFDDRFVTHLYRGDERAAPGTLLTVFPFRRARRAGWPGRDRGAVALAVPPGSAD